MKGEISRVVTPHYVSIYAIVYYIGISSHISSDYSKAMLHRLQEHQGETVIACGKDEDIIVGESFFLLFPIAFSKLGSLIIKAAFPYFGLQERNRNLLRLTSHKLTSETASLVFQQLQGIK